MAAAPAGDDPASTSVASTTASIQNRRTTMIITVPLLDGDKGDK
jgi:hypothetical protein